MAFDRTDSADLAALKSEVINDPTGRGYDPQASEAILLDQLNNPAQNLTPQDGVPPLTIDELWRILTTETVTAADENRLDWLFASSDLNLGTDVSTFRTEIMAMDAGLNTKIAAMTRPMSRAEVLFADLDANGVTEFVTILTADWRAARDS